MSDEDKIDPYSFLKNLSCHVRGLCDFYMAELPQVHKTSILFMNPNCLYAGSGDCTLVTRVRDEAANHYTSGASITLLS